MRSLLNPFLLTKSIVSFISSFLIQSFFLATIWCMITAVLPRPAWLYHARFLPKFLHDWFIFCFTQFENASSLYCRCENEWNLCDVRLIDQLFNRNILSVMTGPTWSFRRIESRSAEYPYTQSRHPDDEKRPTELRTTPSRNSSSSQACV